MKIICKIENEAGLNNYDEILAETGVQDNPPCFDVSCKKGYPPSIL